MNIDDRYAKIRKALEMRPTPGSREVFDLGMWDVEVRSSSTSGTICQVNNKGALFRASEDGADRVGRSQGRLLSDAFFIAACDPDTIRDLLAERDEAASIIQSLTARLAEADRDNDHLKLALQAERQKPMRCAACNGDGQVSRSYGYILCDACNGRGF